MYFKQSVLSVLLLFTILQSCKKATIAEDDLLAKKSIARNTVRGTAYEEGSVILGEKLNNPYTVKICN